MIFLTTKGKKEETSKSLQQLEEELEVAKIDYDVYRDELSRFYQVSDRNVDRMLSAARRYKVLQHKVNKMKADSIAEKGLKVVKLNGR